LISFVEEVRPYFKIQRIRFPELVFISEGMSRFHSGTFDRVFIEINQAMPDGKLVGQCIIDGLMSPWRNPVFGMPPQRQLFSQMIKQLGDIGTLVEATVAKLGPYPETDWKFGGVPIYRTDDPIPEEYRCRTFGLVQLKNPR
jgi:hypothetical protein